MYPQLSFGALISLEVIKLMRTQQRIQGPIVKVKLEGHGPKPRRRPGSCSNPAYCQYANKNNQCRTSENPENRECQFYGAPKKEGDVHDS